MARVRPDPGVQTLDLASRPVATAIGSQSTLLERALRASANPVVVADVGVPDHPIVFANIAFERLTGYLLHEVLGRNCRFLQRDDRDQPGLASLRTALGEKRPANVVLRNYHRNGDLFWNHLTIAPVPNDRGHLTHYVAVLNDVTEARAERERLERKANHDALTGLPNRYLLGDRLSQMIAHAQRHGRNFAVAMIDVDGLKRVNDRFGHAVGDEVLKDVATRLAGQVRAGDMAARFGGDEFVLLLNEAESRNGTAQAMNRVLESLQEEMATTGGKVRIACSAGMSFFPEDGTDGAALLSRADAAMYGKKAERVSGF
jgi:diguanylate cyclase (GGDEF)-like protein/PAS domain S-box-containing protein